MSQAIRIATRMGAAGAVIAGLVMLAMAAAEPVAGQSGDEQPPGPTPTEVPGLLGCSAAPYFSLSDQVPFTGSPVAWWAAGLQPGSQAAVVVVDPQNPQNVGRGFATVDRQCQASGSIVLPQPILYSVQVIGTSATTGAPVTLAAWPRAVAAPPVPPTPTLALPPGAPTNVRATIVNATTARVDWDATGQAPFLITSRLGQLRQPADSRSITVGGLTPGAIICFSVYAVNDAGATLGGVDCVIPPMVPTATPTLPQ